MVLRLMTWALIPIGQVSCAPPRQKQLSSDEFGAECCSVAVSGEGKDLCVDFRSSIGI